MHSAPGVAWRKRSKSGATCALFQRSVEWPRKPGGKVWSRNFRTVKGNLHKFLCFYHLSCGRCCIVETRWGHDINNVVRRPGNARLMALCKSRSFMAFPSAPSQQTAVFHNHHYAPQTQQETQPDRPIGYGAFGVVWLVAFLLKKFKQLLNFFDLYSHYSYF